MKISVTQIQCMVRIIMVLLFLLSGNIIKAQTTTVQGVVRDSATNKPIEFVTVRFDGTTIGRLTDENGKFSLTSRSQDRVVLVAYMGYETRRIVVPINQNTKLDIKLKAEGVSLKEVVVRPGKEKYSKKNNPAVELIKKVIAHKNDYLVTNQDYYTNEEYERILFALNDFEEDKGLLKKFKFLSGYIDTSKIDHKKILPFSVRETMSNMYYRRDPKGTRRIITAHKLEGIDQEVNTESLDGIIKELFKDIDITNNTINLLFNDFISPLSSTSSVNFYKWYIIDTVTIDHQKFVNLGFVPFNTRDVGFMGNIYVKADSTYAVKKVSFRVPSKININYLDEMLVTQDFKELAPDLWIPEKTVMALDASIYGLTIGGIGKIYIEKERNFSDYIFNLPVDAAFLNPSPVIYLSDYKKRTADFWATGRPKGMDKDYNMDDMIKQLRESNKLIDIGLKAADILSTGYIATNKDEEKNKVDLGTALTFYSYNHLEGNRFRLTASTTKNLHPHLFFYGYGAYGTKDGKPKYYGEVTWAFNKKEYHKDEYPRHNLSFAYKYDINSLGQRFLQAERDNIFMSLRSKRYDNMTYDRMAEINYIHELYNGFSYNIFGRTHNENPAGNLKFEKRNEYHILTEVDNIKTTEIGATVRLALKEKFFQQRRKRRNLPSDGFIFSLSHTMGLKGVLGGQYHYNKSALSVDKEFWIAPYGRLGMSLKGEKVWGEAPFPLLLSANANSSLTIQRGSFYMLRALEFINDSQLTWDINYRPNGWIFNRIPFLKALKWREFFGFRGFWGNLSKRNDPEFNRNLLVFPEDTYKMSGKPYMEYSIGIQNIFQFFRIDYVRRLNYLDHPGIDKSGFRISFDMEF